MDLHNSAAQMIRKARNIVVFTGAGISTESGIPDFRSPGGVWSRYNQNDLTYQRFRSGEKYRRLYWEYDNARFPAMRDALPNAAHKAVVELENLGKLAAVVTQNIDGLHAKAGNSKEKIIELHGTVHEVTCLDCGKIWPRLEIIRLMDENKIEVPYCDECSGPLKCATIAFGQALNAEVLEKAYLHAAESDLFLTIGSSLVVQPANGLPIAAKRTGAALILINMTGTALDGIMDIVITGKAGPAMEKIMNHYRGQTG